MAADIQMGGVPADRIIIGTDFTRTFQVLDIDADPTGETAKDVAGQAYTFDIRQDDYSGLPPILTASLTITGVFNSVASVSTQRLVWTCLAADLTTALFGRDGGAYRYSVKRTDTGVKTVVQFGTIVIERVTQT